MAMVRGLALAEAPSKVSVRVDAAGPADVGSGQNSHGSECGGPTTQSKGHDGLGEGRPHGGDRLPPVSEPPGPTAHEYMRVDRDGAITTVTFNRPERRNGLNSAMLREFEALLHQVRDDRVTRALIVTGTGVAFCAGAEPAAVSEQAGRGDLSGSPAGGPRMIGRIFDELAHLEVMTVAAVNGHAIGGGWSLALAADYCLAVPEAEFWVPEVDFGVPFRGLSSFALTHRLGPWLAKEATILCRHFGAEELCRLGVVNRVVAPEDLMSEARAVAERFAAQPARAANATKRDVNAVLYGSRHY